MFKFSFGKPVASELELELFDKVSELVEELEEVKDRLFKLEVEVNRKKLGGRHV
jgi:hypothetical protein